MKSNKLTLANIGSGELMALADRELTKICENIADPAVKTEGIRTLTIKVKIKPDKKGQTAQMSYACTSALVPTDPGADTAFIAMDPESKIISLFEADVRQREMFTDPTISEIRPVSGQTSVPVPEPKVAPPMSN
jgi:hypothetical protein